MTFKLNIQVSSIPKLSDIEVGMVFPVKGGRGMSRGNMYVLFAITNDGTTGLCFTVDREGNPVGVSQYAMYYLREQTPIAFVDGLDQLNLTMRSL